MSQSNSDTRQTESNPNTAAQLKATYSPYQPPRLYHWLEAQNTGETVEMHHTDWLAPLIETNGKVMLQVDDKLVGYSKQKRKFITRRKHDTERAMKRTGRIWQRQPMRTWEAKLLREIIQDWNPDEITCYISDYTSVIERFDNCHPKEARDHKIDIDGFQWRYYADRK
jgi:hypothetical protein